MNSFLICSIYTGPENTTSYLSMNSEYNTRLVWYIYIRVYTLRLAEYTILFFLPCYCVSFISKMGLSFLLARERSFSIHSAS